MLFQSSTMWIGKIGNAEEPSRGFRRLLIGVGDSVLIVEGCLPSASGWAGRRGS